MKTYPSNRPRYSPEVYDAVEENYQRSQWPGTEMRQGDFLLIEIYDHDIKSITKPILGVMVAMTAMDQAVCLYYTPWWRERKGAAYEDPEICLVIDWSDSLQFLGHWKYRPKATEVCQAYRRSLAWKCHKALRHPPARQKMGKTETMTSDLELR